MPLTADQRSRYERNWLIPGFGEDGQERLAKSKVAIIGLGGLGSPAALYLAAAGVGTLYLFDSDRVELSNLQRQILHTTPRLGMPKTDSAAAMLRTLNPNVKLHTITTRVRGEGVADMLSDFDAIVEATDNYESKFLLNDACLQNGRPLATAGILSLSGQAMFIVPGQTPCLRCAVSEVPEGVPTTAQLGVLGTVPGILGSVEAMEVLRWLAGLWKPEPEGQGRLHSVDGETMRLRTLRIPRRTDCACARHWK